MLWLQTPLNILKNVIFKKWIGTSNIENVHESAKGQNGKITEHKKEKKSTEVSQTWRWQRNKKVTFTWKCDKRYWTHAEKKENKMRRKVTGVRAQVAESQERLEQTEPARTVEEAGQPQRRRVTPGADPPGTTSNWPRMIFLGHIRITALELEDQNVPRASKQRKQTSSKGKTVKLVPDFWKATYKWNNKNNKNNSNSNNSHDNKALFSGKSRKKQSEPRIL